MEYLSLKELINEIKVCLEENFDQSYWVVAEISELKVNQKGHCYMDLVEKENDEILAKIRATIWSYTYRNLSGWFEAITHVTLKPGMKILCNAVVNYHEVYGLSLNIRDIDPKYTIGERALRRQEILNKLTKDGVINMNKEIPLPLVAQRIAIIASQTSAGYQDFIEQLKFNPFGYRFDLSLFPAVMQGREAELSIINALIEAHNGIDSYDLLVIIRGGGASLDLDCFDSYDLASHVAQFPIPVVTGIGHERDETITDIVANTKLKTPTAVAEFLIGGLRKFEERIDDLYLYIADFVLQSVKEHAYRLEELSHNLKYLSKHHIEKKENRLADMIRQFIYGSKIKINGINAKINEGKRIIRKNSLAIINQHYRNLGNHQSRIADLNPKNVLKRGFSITRQKGAAIKDPEKINKEEKIVTELYKGKIITKIID